MANAVQRQTAIEVGSAGAKIKT